MSFTKHISKILGDKLGISPKLVEKSLNEIFINDSHNSSEISEEGKKSTEHECERIPKGKSEQCGKTPTRSILDNESGELRWYCGTEKSGCYKIVFANISKGKTRAKAKKIPKQVSKPSTNRGRKEAADAKSIILAKKIIPASDVHISRYETKNGKFVRMEKETRILFRLDTKEAYGVLAGDDKTIKKLGATEIRWLETHELTFEKDEVEINNDSSTSEEGSKIDSSDDSSSFGSSDSDES